MNNDVRQAIDEAIAALGDIPADQITKQQRLAYRLCISIMVKYGYLENYIITPDPLDNSLSGGNCEDNM